MRFIFPFAFIFLISCPMSERIEAQQISKTIQDYFCVPYNYSPSDPWTRGKVFNQQTGNSGFFYNCDNEECKRNSPYICWKTNYGHNFPKWRGLWRGLKSDVADVRQRIADGGCGNDSAHCECTKCSRVDGYGQTDTDVPCTNLSESEEMGRMSVASLAPPMIEVVEDQEQSERMAATTVSVRNAAVRRYGLLSGVTVQSAELSTPIRETPIKTSGSLSLLDRFRDDANLSTGQKTSPTTQWNSAKLNSDQATRFADQAGAIDRSRIIKLR